MKRKIISKVLATTLATTLTFSTLVFPCKVANASIISKVESALFTAKSITGAYKTGRIIISFKDDSELSIRRAKLGLFRGIDFKKLENLTPKTEENESVLDSEDTETESTNFALLTLKSLKEKDLISVINQLLLLPQIKYAEPDYFCSIEELEEGFDGTEEMGKQEDGEYQETTIEDAVEDGEYKETTSADETELAIAPNDPSYGKLYGLTKVDVANAWARSTGKNVVVGVIDTGVDYNHEDLKDNMWKNPGEIAGDGIDNDKNGYIDDVYGWDFADNDNDPMDQNSHGTHCAGIIAAVGNNSKGVTGVAYNTKICALKVFNAEGKGFTTSNAIKALQYCKNKSIAITNNSWASDGYSLSLRDMISSYGLFIAAAGNDGRNIDEKNKYPAGYNCKNIISVANSNSSDTLSTSSNYGVKQVDLAAPGSSIYSTIPESKYGYKSGTSMAAPCVTGAAALLKSYHRYLTAEQIKDCILNGVDKVDGLKDKVLTGGRLNINHVVRTMCYYDGKDFTPVYDFNYYLTNNADVKKKYGTNDVAVFNHFITTGMQEGRRGNRNFIYNIYRNNYPELVKTYGNKKEEYYFDYVETGKKNGRSGYMVQYSGTSVLNGIDYSPVYDFKYYCNYNSTVKDTSLGDPKTALNHFVKTGMQDGLRANTAFNLTKYKNDNPDLVALYGDDNTKYYMHYINESKI